ncbi:MAG: hypothetical protein AAF039_06565 [Bacteroidota bacterium]
MKKLVAAAILLTCFSCSDGDLQIETLDFDSVSIQDCSDINVSTSNLLFKINATETLILQLQSGVLNNGNSVTDTVETMSTVPGQSRLIYRVFSDNLTSSFFCDDFPPASPTVIQEIEAEDGSIIIKSIAINDSTQFSHTIQLSGISLVNDSGERITDLSINDFGEITTPISN